jgi:hypothetical protein
MTMERDYEQLNQVRYMINLVGKTSMKHPDLIRNMDQFLCSIEYNSLNWVTLIKGEGLNISKVGVNPVNLCWDNVILLVMV